MRRSVLVVDDDAGALRFAADALAADYEVTACATGTDAIATLATRTFDAVFTDLGMPAPDGFAVLAAVAALAAPPPAIVFSGTDRVATTLRALRAGACDYLLKPATVPELLDAARRAAPGVRDDADYGLVGAAPALERVRRLVPLLARSRETVLIVGETGTGKELFARALHDHGPRAGGPFVAHNVAAVPSELAESVFFGHVRGAFSGAHADHAGLFEQAHGGTLFLDELDSLALGLQAKLLRVLETLRVQRLGSGAEREVDVRVVAASGCEPGDLVMDGRFRADLYYRLRQIEVVMPPLRERLDDVPALVSHVLDTCRREQGRALRLSAEAEARLRAHAWPGNVRELLHAVRAAATLCESGVIEPRHLPRALAQPPRAVDATAEPLSLAAAERLAIARALGHAGGNHSLAARLLGIDRGTLARKLRRDD
jgi:DNA-binding NtrC family response regulator